MYINHRIRGENHEKKQAVNPALFTNDAAGVDAMYLQPKSTAPGLKKTGCDS
jgi:hypothetical protein